MNEYTQCGHYLNMFGKEDYVLMDQIRNSKAKNVMIDIGANVGFYSLFSSLFLIKLFRLSQPQKQSPLKNNIELSSKRNISVFPYGISNQGGLQ